MIFFHSSLIFLYFPSFNSSLLFSCCLLMTMNGTGKKEAKIRKKKFYIRERAKKTTYMYYMYYVGRKMLVYSQNDIKKCIILTIYHFYGKTRSLKKFIWYINFCLLYYLSNQKTILI